MEPIWNERVLKCEKALVIADLHIGYERELEKKGINVPSQSKKMIKNVSELLKNTEVKKLVINGDFKHNIPKSSWQEYNEIPEAVDQWLKIIDEIHLLPGNHDGGIDRYLPSDVILHDSSGAVIDGVGFFHGHAHPSDEVLSTNNLVIAHCHPTVSFIDSLDEREKKECWVKMEYKNEKGDGEAVLIPHLNPLLGGVSVNEDGYLGPFLKNSRLLNEGIYLLDGTYVGKRKELLIEETKENSFYQD